jgi:hypothetical protein
MSSLENSLYRSVSRYQENLLEEAKNFVGNWLIEQDDFEAAVDWLFSEESNELLETNKGTFAFDMVTYAIESFGTESDNDEDEDEDDDETDADEETADASDRSDFYDQVRDFFNC